MKNTLLLLLFIPYFLAAQLTQEFKTHWFDGHAEISSYELTQSRYGEQRQGKAVLIYVTEDFLAEEQVKANRKSKTTLPVLKVNRTKHFLTGIYPYSIMSSSFNALKMEHPIVKAVASIQEWCGQSYLQLNNRKKEWQLTSHSYFEGEADQQLTLEKTVSEDALWNLLRFDPTQLPVGTFSLLPSLEVLRLDHLDAKALPVEGTLAEGSYHLNFLTTGRQFTLYFDVNFPYTIEGWEDTYPSKGENYTSKAVRIHTERRQYWQENNTADEPLRTPFKLN